MHGRGIIHALVGLVALVSAPLAVVALAAAPAGATTVSNESEFRTAFANAAETSITLGANITLTCGAPSAAQRTSATALTIDGGGTFSITQTCANTQNLVQNGSGAINLVGVTLHGGNTGVSSVTGDVTVTNSTIETLTDAAAQVTGINAGGSVTLDHSTINDLSGTTGTLGILSFGASVNVTNGSTITNIVGTGSAIGVDAATGALTVTDSTVAEVDSANLAYGLDAGAGNLVVTGSHVGPITSTTSAFGVLASGGAITLDQSVVDGVAGSNGPALGVAAAVGTIGAHGSTVTNVESSGEAAIGVSGNAGVTLEGVLVHAVTSKTTSAIGVVTSGTGTIAATGTTVSAISGAGDASALGVGGGSSTSLSFSAIEDVTMSGTGIAIGAAGGDVVFTDSAISGTSSVGGEAFGLESAGDAHVIRSTITGTFAPDFAGGVGTAGDATVVNSTITGNAGFGVLSNADATIVYSDIVNNGTTVELAAGSVRAAESIELPAGLGTLVVPGAGVRALASDFGQVTVDGTLTLFGTVLAQPVGSFENCPTPQTVVSAGYNFADDTSCALTGTGDRQGAGLDPQLGALAFNGGPTQTLAIAQTSPLFDAIPAAACQSGPAAGITTDQRGEARPSYTGCDIGAFEIQAPAPVNILPRFTG